MSWKFIATELLLLVASLALGLSLHGTAAQIVLFSLAAVLLLALAASAIWSSDWFWKQVAKRAGPHFGARSESAAVSVSPTDEELGVAIDDIQDELATIHSRLSDAIEANFYGYNFYLPSEAYAANKKAISARSREAREVLSEVYVGTDALNGKMPGPTADGIAMEHVQNPDAARLREIVSRAQATLRQLRP